MATTIERPAMGRRLGAHALASNLVQVVCLVLTIGALLVVANRSFDHTDEAYYVAWIRQPDEFRFLYQPFSHFLHPFYELFGRSIVGLRVFGYALTAGTGALLGLYVQRYYERRFGIVWGDRSLPVLGAFFSLAFFGNWLLTPSYNLLVNAGAALLMTGCLGWLTPSAPNANAREGGASNDVDPRADRIASLLVGLGGCVAFYGKPTFAAIGALVVFVLLVGTARRRFGLAVERAAIVAIACVVPLIGIILYTQPIGEFVDAVLAGTKALRFGNSITDVPFKTIREFYDGPPILFIVLTALAFCIVRALTPSQDGNRKLVMLLAAISVLVLLSLVRALWVGGLIALMIYCAVLCIIGFGLLGSRTRAPLPELAFVFVLLLVPFAIAVGSANPLMLQIGVSLFAVLLAAVIAARILFDQQTARLIATGLSVGFLALMAWGAMRPYGMTASLLRQTEPIDLGFTSDRLYVDASTKTYVDGLRATAAQLRLAPGTPIVDLSGSGPGNVMFLNGSAPEFPWLVNFTEGAPILVDAVWDAMTPSERARAWILGPVHPGMRKAKLVAALSADQSGYACVAQIANDYWADKQAVLTFWKPRGLPGALPVPCGANRIVPAGMVDR